MVKASSSCGLPLIVLMPPNTEIRGMTTDMRLHMIHHRIIPWLVACIPERDLPPFEELNGVAQDWNVLILLDHTKSRNWDRSRYHPGRRSHLQQKIPSRQSSSNMAGEKAVCMVIHKVSLKIDCRDERLVGGGELLAGLDEIHASACRWERSQLRSGAEAESMMLIN